MHFCFAIFIFFFVRTLLVNLLIKLLDSSCVLFFLVTIFVGWKIWNKSKLKAKTGSDSWKDGEAENDCCVWKSALRLWKTKTITPFSLYLARKNKTIFYQAEEVFSVFCIFLLKTAVKISVLWLLFHFCKFWAHLYPLLYHWWRHLVLMGVSVFQKCSGKRMSYSLIN